LGIRWRMESVKQMRRIWSAPRRPLCPLSGAVRLRPRRVQHRALGNVRVFRWSCSQQPEFCQRELPPPHQIARMPVTVEFRFCHHCHMKKHSLKCSNAKCRKGRRRGLCNAVWWPVQRHASSRHTSRDNHPFHPCVPGAAYCATCVEKYGTTLLALQPLETWWCFGCENRCECRSR
jgi:hypothetical protein